MSISTLWRLLDTCNLCFSIKSRCVSTLQLPRHIILSVTYFMKTKILAYKYQFVNPKIIEL